MRRLLLFSVLIVSATDSARGAWFTNSVSADAFVRAAAPAANYGGAGALLVSGTAAVNGAGVGNGVFDSFIRFNTAAMVASFNSLYGANGWAINGATLRVTELGAPANTLFNRGKGAFSIRWIANDNWTEGTGQPNTPTTTGITFGDEPSLLNTAQDAALGTFTNAGVDGTLSFPLALHAAFVNDLQAGGEMGLYLTAVDAGTGFTVDSRSFGTVTSRPFLEISAVPRPGIAGLSVSGNDLLLAATNGLAGATYQVLTSTNAAQPLDQWQPVAAKVLPAGGTFSITLTNAAAVPGQRFFRLEMR